MDCGGSSGSGTWSRSGPPKKEELVGGKKKGRTWGPSSTLQKERAGGEERYGVWLPTCPCTCLPLALALTLSPCAPAGSRPWGKEASSGPRAPPTWANPPSIPPWPQASPASMRWVRVWALWGVVGTGEILAEGMSLRPRRDVPRRHSSYWPGDWHSFSEARLWRKRFEDDSGS